MALASRSSGLDIPFVETEPVRESVLPSQQPPMGDLLLAPGHWIAGRYQIIRKIGEGGMGVLYACHDGVLARQVAVKLLQRSLAGESAIAERLMREARLAAQLHHHVAQVFDCGMLETGEPYIVMELLSGRDLYALLRESGPLSVPELSAMMLQVCAGLAEAHAQGIVHRDLKPENLFQATEPDGSVVLKILDFGVSKQLGPRRMRSQTSPTESVGSPQYMSPEQIMTPSEVDARTDIWSLGVVMFELLTQSLPFNGSGPAQICASILTDSMPSISQYRSDVPLELEALVRRCLEKKREQRFASVHEVAQALNALPGDRARASAVERAEPALDSAAPELEVSQNSHHSRDSALAVPRRRRWVGALVSAVVLCGCLGVLGRGVREGRIHVPSHEDFRQLSGRLAAWGRSLPWLTSRREQ